ncbi:MAG TPA: addiction module protein [Salinisphaera sp.]|nr:addiction module protein [Salinisphaera sp.]
MNNQNELEIERHALEIPPEARLRLAAKLLSSVPNTARSSLSEEQALDLAEKRAEELDSGKVAGLDYREEMDRIRSSLSR